MIHLRCGIAVATLALVAVGSGGSAFAQTQAGEIKGQDVMGDKSKSATDGWVQAPIPREESASKDAPNPGGQSTQQNANRPVPDAPSSRSPGEEPQGALEHRTASPTGNNPAQPTK